MVSLPTLSPQQIAEELRPVILRIGRHLRRETEQPGITSQQATLLWLVKSRPGLSLRELARAEGISAPSLSAHVDRLEALGLIRRVRSTDDRRRVGLELTPEGRAMLRRVRARRTSWLAERLARLSDEDRERVEQALPSRSALAVGALAFCRFLPFLVLGLVAGVVVDRIDTRRLLLTTQATAMVVSVVLAVVTLMGVATLPLVYVLAALGGLILVFDSPGRQTLTFQMVGPAELQNAVALNSGLFNASRVIGPALAGLTIAVAGVGVCFVVNAVSFLAVLVALKVMREDELMPVERSGETRVIAGIREGLSWSVRSPVALTVLTVVTIVSMVGFNFNVLVPLLASQTLHVGPGMFGVLSASFGIGALLGALATATLRRASLRTFGYGAVGFSVVMLGLAPVRTSGVALVLLFA